MQTRKLARGSLGTRRWVHEHHANYGPPAERNHGIRPSHGVQKVVTFFDTAEVYGPIRTKSCGEAHKFRDTSPSQANSGLTLKSQADH